MLLQGGSFSSGMLLSRSSTNCRNIISFGASTSTSSSKTSTAAATVVCASVGIDQIAEIAHNRVLISAAVSATIGQLSKPFTSAIVYGDRGNPKFNVIKAAFQAGGFPSTHSSAVVATATSLGLERGFSDAIFGLAVVYASLVMYDAQGVRREVGNHAKVLNRVILQNSVPSKDATDVNMINCQPRKSSSLKRERLEPPHFLEKTNSFSTTKQSNVNVLLGASDVEEEDDSEKVGNSRADVPPVLKESVGHNEIEVTAGALLGLFVSLAVYTIT